MNRSRPAARYVLWHARDYAVGRAPLSLLVGVLLVAPTIATARSQGVPLADLQGVLEQDVLVYAVLALVVFAVHGLVALDRESGFAAVCYVRPVNVAIFYLQKWIAHGVLMLGLTALGCVIYSRWLGFPYPADLLTYAGLSYVLLGGIGFLASTFTRFDSGVALLCFVIPRLVHEATVDAASVWVQFRLLLPPSWLLDAVMGRGVVDVSETGVFLWCCAYGIGAVGLALIALRRPSVYRSAL